MLVEHVLLLHCFMLFLFFFPPLGENPSSKNVCPMFAAAVFVVLGVFLTLAAVLEASGAKERQRGCPT